MHTQSHSHEGAPEQREAPAASRAEARERELSWPLVGAASGLLGALVIAVFFLGIDIAESRPLWTPSALGSALFLGERMAEDAPARPALLLGYTCVHGAFFLSAGLMASFGLSQRRRRPGLIQGIALAGLFFAVFEILILGFLQLTAPGLSSTLGLMKVTTANLLAAGSAAAFLAWMSPRIGGP